MLTPRLVLLAAVLFAPLQPALAAVKGNPTSEALRLEGDALLANGKLQEAIEKYTKANNADPKASAPLSSIATVFMTAARAADGAKAAELRKHATSAANAALKVDENDPMGQEVLRRLDEDVPYRLYQPSLDAARLVEEGEQLFAAQDYAKALAKYEQAIARDPGFSQAWVFAGDCYYVQSQWTEAEARFRKATEIEPMNSQAWRFLSDSLVHQRKWKEAEQALLAGIAAHPGQLPNWGKLADLQHPSLPLKRIGLQKKATATVDPATGKPTLNFSESLSAPEKKAEMEFWLAYGLAQAAAQLESKKGKPAVSPFKAELDAWNTALGVLAKDPEAKVSDPALVSMQKIYRENHLESAVLLLMFREAYRPEFEEWKKRNPDGVRIFVTRYGLRP